MSPSLPGFRLPLSPASPPESGIKHQLVDQQTTVAPRTPPSPAHSGMSVATKSYVSSYENNRRTDEMGDRSPPEMYSQPAHRPNANSTPQQNNLKRPIPPDEGDRSFNKRQKKTAAGLDIDEEHSFTATNHDRQNARNGATGGATHEASAAPLGSAPSTDVHAVLGPTRKAFLVGSSTHSRSTIDVSRHLLGIFGLHPLLATVARTGPYPPYEKINKLRKSYEGQIKTAGLSGRNKPYREDRDPEDGGISKLRKLATMAEDEFEQGQVERKIGDLGDLRDKLQSALRLNPGAMKPQTTNEWDEILGHETQKSRATQIQAQQVSHHLQQARMNGIRPGQTMASAIPPKMTTRGKKRSYDDSSFSGYPGYGDGFSEPEEQSDRDRDWADRGKKRRRD